MREGSISTDDLAIQAAKNRLVDIPSRDGYADAMNPKVDTSRTVQIVMLSFAAFFAVLVVAVWMTTTPGIVMITVALLLVTLTVFSVLAGMGSAPVKPPRAFAAAVIGKSHEDRDPSHGPTEQEPEHRLLLLDEQGNRTELIANEELYALLKTGDAGVAHQRNTQLVGFVRL